MFYSSAVSTNGRLQILKKLFKKKAQIQDSCLVDHELEQSLTNRRQVWL